MLKRMDLSGLDYKMIDGFIILTSNMKVYTLDGTCKGELPKGVFPQSGQELLEKVKPIKEKVIVPEVVAPVEHKSFADKVKLSVKGLKGEK